VGGVGYERLIVTSEVVQSIDTKKFIPIIPPPSGRSPNFIGHRLFVDFRSKAQYAQKLEELAREIHGSPATSKPPLGSNPFSDTPIETPAVATKFKANAFDENWIQQQQQRAEEGAKSLAAFMELSTGTTHLLRVSQNALLDSVRKSEIRTFGWPIGVTLENREEFRPKPVKDGIRAEVAIDKESGSRPSYDYWALKSDGDFYLRQSLFEDQRTTNAIFFDTRIVRVTESLMFAERLYRNLGVPPDALISVRIGHTGLRGRKLISASANRYLSMERTADEDEISYEIETTLADMSEDRVAHVKALLGPMFVLFDFMKFDDDIYEEIVRRFERGENW
jgi:hypothetical protein